MTRASTVLAALAALGLAMLTSTASASAELAKARNCTACHAADKRVLGPAFKDIAVKYASDKDAAVKLARKVREGGVGVWGQVPMPANPQVTADEAAVLVKWILGAR